MKWQIDQCFISKSKDSEGKLFKIRIIVKDSGADTSTHYLCSCINNEDDNLYVFYEGDSCRFT